MEGEVEVEETNHQVNMASLVLMTCLKRTQEKKFEVDLQRKYFCASWCSQKVSINQQAFWGEFQYGWVHAFPHPAIVTLHVPHE